MRKLMVFVPFVAFLVLGFFLYKGLFMDPTKLPSALIDRPLPEFALPSLYEPEQILTQDDLKGEIALLNVWATWCATCKEEHEQLNKIGLEEGIPIYGLNYKDDPQLARDWLQRYNDPYSKVIVDREGRLGLDLGVYGAPETYILDRAGVIRYRHVGEVNEKVWQQLKGLMDTIAAEEGA
ncbi:DsbE family thiol:disulfide interchange protein [Nitrincola iocasae]|jgi:cytochrome c biogenesis protein CcmG/thiol:disulfide interchange protein DsbE|uniref:DsbE family thiol:disulfide interchange protein n=1 Tax=Nitrincola iocasae TaxID=2614693 RepID=A0A5J6LGL4_9GAMM|nr:DsbE family thiol:disulfide interchange protein [Nitrincola iocasae]QEW07598.1 DsbE family thiol:disulfide interchange protein [Nitrincola iocasae]